MSALADRSSLILFSYDLTTHKFDYVNHSFEEFFGTSDTVTYSELFALLHPDDKDLITDKVKECIENSHVMEVECRFIRRTKQRSLLIEAFVEQMDGRKVIIGQGKDVTNYKQYIDNLNNHNSKKNSILNILSHDLSGPIGTVGNLSEILKKETSNLHNVKISKCLDMIDEISKRSINLIRNFISQEFLESQSVNLLKKRVDLVSKIESATQEYFHLKEHSGLLFSFTSDKDKIYVDIDEDKFLQVISNLISNAVKFTPAGGKISVHVEQKHESVLILITDSGIGIPEQYHKTLFDKFTDARRPGLNGEPTTGLGMSIIKTIIDWHQGRIWFDSTENKGTTFFISLPK